jgi:hypothetical protein
MKVIIFVPGAVVLIALGLQIWHRRVDVMAGGSK